MGSRTDFYPCHAGHWPTSNSKEIFWLSPNVKCYLFKKMMCLIHFSEVQLFFIVRGLYLAVILFAPYVKSLPVLIHGTGIQANN